MILYLAYLFCCEEATAYTGFISRNLAVLEAHDLFRKPILPCAEIQTHVDEESMLEEVKAVANEMYTGENDDAVSFLISHLEIFGIKCSFLHSISEVPLEKFTELFLEYILEILKPCKFTIVIGYTGELQKPVYVKTAAILVRAVARIMGDLVVHGMNMPHFLQRSSNNSYNKAIESLVGEMMEHGERKIWLSREELEAISSKRMTSLFWEAYRLLIECRYKEIASISAIEHEDILAEFE
ncbi:hypothetical protein ENBRE01_2881 [Enteropsectra breve]|nr:hypothetical protein ENBRE01_2881 [Enteropsectra breve]